MPADVNHLKFCRDTLDHWLQRLQQPGFSIHLPKPLGRYKRITGTHFHFYPELFLQTGGMTEFSFPHENTDLFAGESLLVPRGLPHAEVARTWRGDFLNLVVMFSREGITLHAAKQEKGNTPRVRASEFFKTSKGPQLAQYLDDISDLHSTSTVRGEPETGLAIKGLFQSALANLLLVVKQAHVHTDHSESPKVRECRIFIISHLYEPSLSVKRLADQLHCSADYLSHLYATETGQRLTDFIQQERMALAKQNLSNPTLSIKEIAWSCGFSDPGYFTRLFRHLSGETPKSFRKKAQPALT